MATEKLGKLQISNIPKRVLITAKVQAASEDRTLTSWVIEALEEKLKRSDPSRRWPPEVRI